MSALSEGRHGTCASACLHSYHPISFTLVEQPSQWRQASHMPSLGDAFVYLHYQHPLSSTPLNLRNSTSSTHLHSPTYSTSTWRTAVPPQALNLDRYVVIYVVTTCDEHGAYVTKDSAGVDQFHQLLLSINYPPNVPIHQLSFSTNIVFANSSSDPRFTIA